MKKIVLIVLCASSYISQAQNTSAKFDKIVSEYVLAQWENHNDLDSEKYNDSALTELKLFQNQLSENNAGIGSKQFFKKPSDNTLVGHYLTTKLKWNSFNRGAYKLPNKKVIKQNLKNLPQTYELLGFYYKSIFGHLLNNQHDMNLGGKNIDLHGLGFSNDTENAIFFLCVMKQLGGQITSYCSGSRFPQNCWRGERLVNNMPTFDGKIFYEYELPDYEDFLFEIDKRYPKKSFKEEFELHFELAKSSYLNCLKEKK